MITIEAILAHLLERGASTAHLVPGEPVAIRAAEGLVRVDKSPDAQLAIDEVLNNRLSPNQRASLDRRGYVDASLVHAGNRFICRLFHERGQVAATIRILPSELPSLDSLVAIDEELARIAQLLQFRRGVIIVTGASGSGKSNLAAALLGIINENQTKRIATVEDPPQYDIVSRKSIVTQMMIGHDVDSFQVGLDAIRGLDADVVFASSIPDAQAFESICTLAQRGRLVLSVMPYPTVTACIKGILDTFAVGQRARIQQLLSQNLQAIVSTALIQRAAQRERAAAHEIMIATLKIRAALQDGRWEIGPLMKEGRRIGMQTLDDSLEMLYKQGIIDFDEAEGRISDKTVLGRRPA